MFRYFTKVNNSLEANSKYIFYTHTPSAKSLPFQIGACGHFFCAKDYNVERAGHNFLLIIVTLSGSGEIFYKNRHYTLHKGHAFIIDCSEYHYYRTRGQSWEIKWVRYKCHKAIDYNQLINKGSLEIIFMENAAMINKYIDTIILLSQRHSPTTHFSLSNLISAILTELCMIQYENSSQHIAVSTRKTIFDAVLYIEKNYTEQLSINNIAKDHYINIYSFIRQFKKQIGLSPYEYLLNLRITESRVLLEHSNHSVNEISDLVGFNNQNGFIKKFKQLTGITPLEYRKLNS